MTAEYASQRLAQAYLATLIRDNVDKTIEMMRGDENAKEWLEEWYAKEIAGWVADADLPEHPNADQLDMVMRAMEAMDLGIVQVRRMSSARVSQLRKRMRKPDHPWHGMTLEKYTDEFTLTDNRFTVYLNAGEMSEAPLATRANPLL